MAKKLDVTKNEGNTTYAEQVARREKIKQRLSALKAEIQEASSDQTAKRLKAEEANREVSRYIKTIKDENERTGKGEDHMDVYQKERLDALKETAKEAEKSAVEASERFEHLTAEINDLERELADFTYSMGAEEVLQHQKDMAEAEKKVSDLQTLIQQQQEIINKANAQIKPMPDYKQKREALLAEIAIGKASDADLKRFDEQAAEESKAITEANRKLHETINNTQQTITGLRGRLSEAEAELTRLKDKKQEIIFQYLMQQAEQEGHKYVETVLQLSETFKRLVAIDNLMGYPYRLRGINWDSLYIPTFRLKACRGMEHPNWPGQFYEVRRMLNEQEIMAAVESEKERLSSIGINLY